MKTKAAFHELIDTIHDEAKLKSYFELIRKLDSSQSGILWDSLSDDEQKELLVSFEESFDQKNLVPNEEVKKQQERWVKK